MFRVVESEIKRGLTFAPPEAQCPLGGENLHAAACARAAAVRFLSEVIAFVRIFDSVRRQGGHPRRLVRPSWEELVNRTRRDLHPIARSAAGVVLAVAIALSAGLAAASDTDRSEGISSEIGVNAASAALTLVYGPVKLTYSALGIVFGGIAYGLSGGDSDVLHAVITPAIHGDYAVLPKHVRREKHLEFFGRDPAYRKDEIVESVIVEEVY